MFKNARNRSKYKTDLYGRKMKLSYTKRGNSFINWKKNKVKVSPGF